jgi:hypothetical protein
MRSRIGLRGTFGAAIIFVSLLFPSLVQAQDGQEINVRIPFGFSVNRVHFESGDYRFILALDKFEMSVINLETGKKEYVPVRPHDNSLVTDEGFLVFAGAGGDQYLSEVHFWGNSGYSKISVPRESSVVDRHTILKGALRK